ncbi:MAG: type I restriction endonuclease [Oscillospiraceae bacterium]|nr:type I restriction endonuclease [Oscillospiraceae bacterium]
MDLIDELRQFSTKAAKIKDVIKMEEATKTSLVMPFFQLLGYDVFNPLEFVPEFAADFGVKKDARVDYAIMVDESPVILIECKPCGESLEKHSSQLFQYFAATPAKFGILTNGIEYRFYTDLGESNKMDLEPFMTINVLDISENAIPELKRFAKKTLDIDGAFNAAAQLKYMGKIKSLLDEVRVSPPESFVKYMMSEIYSGLRNQKAISEFRPIIKRGFNQYIDDCIADSFKSAMKAQEEKRSVAEIVPEADEEGDDSDIDSAPMSLEELEAFAIVKAILCDMIDIDRLSWQHTKKYMVIHFDNNSWKRICRFWFKGTKKYITTPDENMKPVRHDLARLNDIYKYSEYIKEVCTRYL